MTKKDYQAIAGAIYAVKSKMDDPQAVRADIIWAIADVAQADNPRFDRARFIEACETGKCKGMKGAA